MTDPTEPHDNPADPGRPAGTGPWSPTDVRSFNITFLATVLGTIVALAVIGLAIAGVRAMRAYIPPQLLWIEGITISVGILALAGIALRFGIKHFIRLTNALAGGWRFESRHPISSVIGMGMVGSMVVIFFVWVLTLIGLLAGVK